MLYVTIQTRLLQILSVLGYELKQERDPKLSTTLPLNPDTNTDTQYGY